MLSLYVFEDVGLIAPVDLLRYLLDGV